MTANRTEERDGTRLDVAGRVTAAAQLDDWLSERITWWQVNTGTEEN
jgi:hypothetical protein